MKISYQEIVIFLKKINVNFEVIGNPKDSYDIASLFCPINGGFYYLEESSYFKGIEDSLVLTNQVLPLEKENTILYIQENPQVVYYKLLNFYYKELSTGKICKSAIIHPKAQIGYNVQIDSFVVIGDCIIGDNSIIKSNSVLVDNSTIGENVIIEQNCTIGATGMAWVWGNNGERIKQPQLGGVIIESNCSIGANSTLVRGSLNESTLIGESTVIAPGARIGHGTQIGKFVHLANNVVTGGNTVISDFSFIGSSVTIRPKIKIDANTIIGAGAVVVKNTSSENLTLLGVPAKEVKSKKLSSGVPKSNIV